MYEVETLGEVLPEQIERVEELIAIYDSTPAGAYAAVFMKADVELGKKALAEGDLVKMIAAHQQLIGYKDA